ncbi:TenA family protein [Alloscardovia sp. HMSC034E08]|uniref:TenA family protein n=1 Tax=Alloscardovia sp. HMSC034E08 TaxID=1739413 RepID=UPI0008F93ECA|nr:TenA family protein [Alloscardovia sp. HMSC034E08]
MSENLTPYEYCKQLARNNWEKTVHHRFAQELCAQTLDHAVLRDYLIQDYQFAQDFLSLLGQVLASADTMNAKVRLAQQLGFIGNDENTYFLDRFKQYGVSDEDIENPVLTSANRGFRQLYADAVLSRSYAQGLAVLVVAETIYRDWAEENTNYGRDLPDQEEYRGWIDVHRGDYFDDWCAFLISEFNRVADITDTKITDTFVRAVALERAFFDNAYDSQRDFLA